MHWCSMKVIQLLLFKDSWVLQLESISRTRCLHERLLEEDYINFNKHTITPTFATSFIFDNFIPTYHSLHVCSRQALLCARLAACHVPLVITDLSMCPSVGGC